MSPSILGDHFYTWMMIIIPSQTLAKIQCFCKLSNSSTFRPQFFYFSFNGSADSIFSILRIKIKVYFSFCIFKFAADSKYLTIQKKKSSRALKIFRSCRQNRLKSGMSDVYAHCVGHCDRKTSIAKLRFRNSDPDKMFRSLPQLNVWARTRKEAGVSNVCMTQILCFGPFKTKQSYEESPPGQGIHPES